VRFLPHAQVRHPCLAVALVHFVEAVRKAGQALHGIDSAQSIAQWRRAFDQLKAKPPTLVQQ
jgi:DNA/RNA-binding domain of Phe-tRNA-synthetase-like protein